MIPVRPAKRFQSAANVKPDRPRKGFLKGQFLFAPDISIPENDILPTPIQTDKFVVFLCIDLLFKY